MKITELNYLNSNKQNLKTSNLVSKIKKDKIKTLTLNSEDHQS